ncbi:ATP-binding protein [Paraburkholderia sp. EG304]|uniref:ATP-binding protein n=1 Tax=Paraburkholderia sp. EG304 TaxID=3237015 RepID=UPI00397AA149
MAMTWPAHIDARHCVCTQQYAVYTHPMHEMINTLGDWIDQRFPGGYIYGASRLGKSRCVQWHLVAVLEERFDSILPLVVWNRRADSQRSEAQFWNSILMSSGFEFHDPEHLPKTSKVFNQCKNRFISIAENSGGNYAILLIDEAQKMTLKEWEWLVGMQNQLDYEHYVFSVFSIGSHQLGYVYDYLAETGNAHISARFMAASARFHGLRNCEELVFALNGYDEDSEWPAGSQVSYLKYFAPGAFNNGRRLVKSAPLLWDALLELAPPDAKKHREFPMQHVARTVEGMLRQLANGADWDDVTSYKNLLKELAKTNFSNHMRIIGSVS